MKVRSAVAAAFIVLGCGVQTGQTFGAGLLGVARTLLLFEAAVERCYPGWKVGPHVPKLDKLVALLRDAMVENAMLLKPDIEEKTLRAQVVDFVEKWRADATSAPTAPCDSVSNVEMAAAIDRLGNPELEKVIRQSGETLLPYDAQQHFDGRTDSPTTYALPPTQANVLRGIADNLAGTCNTPTVTAVELVSRNVQADVNSLPPFVLGPITYKEKWEVDCAGQTVAMLTTFTQDSEGPRGAFAVEHDHGTSTAR